MAMPLDFPIDPDGNPLSIARAAGNGVLLLTDASAPLRCRLRPLPWIVLEQLALEAIEKDGRLVAATSARRIAEQLRVDPGEAARALRVLRAAGLVGLLGSGPAGRRFGLASYVLGEIPGLVVLARVDSADWVSTGGAVTGVQAGFRPVRRSTR